MNEKPDTIFKYVSFDIGEAIISNNSLKFTNPKLFNDPFDCDIAGIYFDLNGNIDPKVRSEIAQLKKNFASAVLSNDLLTKAYEETIKAKLDRSVITCFSLDRNNHLMWSHYARNHTGMCLGFDNDIPLKDKFLDLSLGMEGLVLYDLQEKVNFCENKINGNYKLYLTKLKPWAYEREYRLIAISDEGIYHFTKKFLSEVIFGLRASKVSTDRIIRVCKRHKLDHVNFFKAEIKGSEIVYKNLSAAI